MGKGVFSEAGGVFQELTGDGDPGVRLRFRISVWEGVGRGRAATQEPRLDARGVISITVAQVINIPRVKRDEMGLFLSVTGDRGHTLNEGVFLAEGRVQATLWPTAYISVRRGGRLQRAALRNSPESVAVSLPEEPVRCRSL